MTRWDPHNDEGQSEHPSRVTYLIERIQITGRIKRTLHKSIVEHTVAERKKWAKFGEERGNKESRSCYYHLGENVSN